MKSRSVTSILLIVLALLLCVGHVFAEVIYKDENRYQLGAVSPMNILSHVFWSILCFRGVILFSIWVLGIRVIRGVKGIAFSVIIWFMILCEWGVYGVVLFIAAFFQALSLIFKLLSIAIWLFGIFVNYNGFNIDVSLVHRALDSISYWLDIIYRRIIKMSNWQYADEGVIKADASGDATRPLMTGLTNDKGDGPDPGKVPATAILTEKTENPVAQGDKTSEQTKNKPETTPTPVSSPVNEVPVDTTTKTPVASNPGAETKPKEELASPQGNSNSSKDTTSLTTPTMSSDEKTSASMLAKLLALGLGLFSSRSRKTD